MSEGKNIDKYLDFAGELKMLWNVRVGVIPFVISAFGIVYKGLEKRQE